MITSCMKLNGVTLGKITLIRMISRITLDTKALSRMIFIKITLIRMILVERHNILLLVAFGRMFM
jgi:hypothetical protein